tara:strand:- start:10308 stop:10778 length:471 start_codon:yes stop_codon:yes gene_type:complete
MMEGVTMMLRKRRMKIRSDRYTELKQILEGHRLEIIAEVKDKMRDVRSEGALMPRQGVRDEVESTEADIQDDIEFSLLQMKTETLNKVGEALLGLDVGTYGYCDECGEEISEQRLRALPFAVRCKNCEEAREGVRERDRIVDGRRNSVSVFADIIG